MTQSIFYKVETGMGSFVGEGAWESQETRAAPTCQDKRHKRFCFAICVHHIHTRERVASLTGVCPGQVSRQRAFFYGLKHLALHVSEKIQVALYDHQVWKAWARHLACENYPDLFTGLEWEDFEMVRPLLFAVKELKENELRNFLQKDAKHRAPLGSLQVRGCLPEQPVKRRTRIERIQETIDGQNSPVPGQHRIHLDRAYVRCSQCKSYMRYPERQRSTLTDGCSNRPLEASIWRGHPSHMMERMANKVTCTDATLAAR